jgi:hypothetical protein
MNREMPEIGAGQVGAVGDFAVVRLHANSEKTARSALVSIVTLYFSREKFTVFSKFLGIIAFSSIVSKSNSTE